MLHEEPYTRKYKAAKCSEAYCCNIALSIFTLLFTLFVAFTSQGFWKKFGEYWEQPAVYYKQRFIIILRGESSNGYYMWSSYPVLNNAEEANVRIAMTEVYENDYNYDGKPDIIDINVTFPVTENDKIYGVFYMFLFDYQLNQRSRFSMETALLSDLERLTAASMLTISGDLWLDQRAPFRSSGRDPNHGGSLINESSLDLSQYNLSIIASRNSLRNFTTTLRREVIAWEPRRTINKNFVLHLSLRIVEQQLIYQTGLMELLKWAWIQYFALLVVVQFFVNKFRKFLFENGLLNTIIVDGSQHSH